MVPSLLGEWLSRCRCNAPELTQTGEIPIPLKLDLRFAGQIRLHYTMDGLNGSRLREPNWKCWTPGAREAGLLLRYSPPARRLISMARMGDAWRIVPFSVARIESADFLIANAMGESNAT
jgi:hypothetical protein